MNTRTLLLMLLAFLGFMIYIEWQSDYVNTTPQPVEPLPGDRQAAAGDTDDDSAALPDFPPVRDSDQADRPTGDVPQAQVPISEVRSDQRIEVETDRLVAFIDPKGGSLVELRLKDFPVSVDEPDQPFVLLSEELLGFHIAQAGLIDSERRAPNHTTTYEYERDYYELAPNAQTLDVPLTWRNEDGLEVTQTWVFHRDDYVIEHRFQVLNGGDQPWEGIRYLQLQRSPSGGSSGMTFTNPERISFNGAAVYSPEDKFEKLKFSDFEDEPYRKSFDGGWAGMVEHYFLSAWIPPTDAVHTYTTRVVEQQQAPQRYALTATSDPVALSPGQDWVFESELFVGPKEQNMLDAVAPGLSLTVDYGIFTIFSKPLFWALDHIHTFVRNWGLAIILLTLLIKLAFYKLTQAQFRSMGKLRKLQPRIAQLKERYGDDRQKFGQAMMEIYKKEKVNPLGGCLPLLVQIPIFIALYWVLLESVELRQASFLWIPDLSKPDPLFILPVFNGIFMIITQRLTPAAGMDPMQRKIMQFLPVAFAVLFAFFPAGLVLYWASNSGISLLQQWYILRQIDAEDARARA
ncbi:MAG: membrane protein insertase YidC [Wenzhouxiangellaceae bacterium]|nr:membrane protein insertase YidC [Wenzhouxiangellaceae bacterium]